MSEATRRRLAFGYHLAELGVAVGSVRGGRWRAAGVALAVVGVAWSLWWLAEPRPGLVVVPELHEARLPRGPGL